MMGQILFGHETQGAKKHCWGSSFSPYIEHPTPTVGTETGDTGESPMTVLGDQPCHLLLGSK